jgi:hypothetical protein
MFEGISEYFNIKTIFKSRHTIGRYLRNAKAIKEAQESSLCVYKVCC